MKMLLAVLPTQLSDSVSKKLLDADYRVTKFADTFGFLSGGTATLMVVTAASKIPSCLKIIRGQIPPLEQSDPNHARVTMYVLKVKDFTQV